MTDILIVGAGPVGLTLAVELARHGISSRIVDQLAAPSSYCRALGITSRTLEIWEDMGIAREAIDAGIWLRGARVEMKEKAPQDFMGDLSDCPFASLSLPQPETERILTRRLESYGIKIGWGVSLREVRQDSQSVSVKLDHGNGQMEGAAFRYLIGCDGAHSIVRHAAGILFEGETMPYEFMLGDVHIDWELPRGLSYQAIHPAEDRAPDFFIAIPLPEAGRYRVSMLAPDELRVAGQGSDHGIQSERPAPGLERLQAVADRLIADGARLSDLRWSSIFRISMRLANRYREGNIFIAGDAAHIHPPTGGQGMNTGIQDAYNLAWKMALVLKGVAHGHLLDSYHAERREEGMKVVERTSQATVNNKSRGFTSNRLADTQLLVSYRNSPLALDSLEKTADADAPAPGDRAPDCLGLRRQGLGFPFRLFEILQGTEHVLLMDVRKDTETVMKRVNTWKANLPQLFGQGLASRLRVVVISGESGLISPAPGIVLLEDPESSFAKAYHSQDGTAWLIRPDGYIGWRGANGDIPGLTGYLDNIFQRV